MRTRSLSIVPAVAAALFLVACGGGDDAGDDVDARRIDAPMLDAAETDAPDIDAPSIDAAVDAPTDAMVDAAVDAMPTPSESIGFVRAASGAVSIPVMNVTVTYLKPVGGNPTSDPAGFTVQAVQNGPAVMIAVDPATLTPVPVVGDVVSFTVTNVTVAAGQPRATAITGFARVSQGADVGALAQNVSAATDLVTAIDSYDSEIIDVSGSIAGAFGSAGAGFESAQITTTGMGTPAATFVVRVPTTVRDAADMAMGCTFTLDNTPVHKFTSGGGVTSAQLTAFVPADFTLSNCPAPVVTNAVALSATEVRITFSRLIDTNSVNANGSQFTFDNGLTASAAVVSGRTVTLTTSPQSNVTLYTVTVANTVTDQAGTAMGTPNMFMFMGYITQAVVKINELNANVTMTGIANCDLVELRVVSGGLMTGYKLQERTGTASNNELSFTFPALTVQTNDIIVVHMNANAGCNPGSSPNETTGPAQHPRATYGANFDTAYDFYANDNGLTNTDNVITLYDAVPSIMDAVFVTDAAAGTAAAGTETQAAACAAANQWQMVGGGTPVGGYIDDSFNMHAVLDLDGTSTNWTGNTIQRLDNSDDNDLADWNNGADLVRAHTWGLINAGQTPF